MKTPVGESSAARKAAREAARKAAEAAARKAEEARRQAEQQRLASQRATQQDASMARAAGENRAANLVERTTGSRAALNLSAAAAPPLTSSPYAADIAGANAYFSQLRYSDEAPGGSTAATAIAENALSDETAVGTDGDLNCVEAVVEGQELFADRGIDSEIVVAEDHAVLRLPDRTYYDPTTQSLVPQSEAARYDGIDGITVDEREVLEDAARAAADGLGTDASPEARREAATRAVEQKASAAGIDEPSATARANDVEATDPTEAKLDADVAEIEAAAAEDPERGANLLEEKLQSAAPEYREQLVGRAQPVISTIAGTAATSYDPADIPNVVGSLSRSAELVSPASQQLLGQAVVTGVVQSGQETALSDSWRFGGAFTQAMANGDGASLGLAVADAARLNDVGGADAIETAMLGATSTVRANFREAQQDVDALNGELYTYLEAYGPYMTEAEQQAAVSKWMEDNRETYERWEQYGAQMVPVLESAQGAINDPNASEQEQEWAQAVLQQQLPQVAFTQAGQQLLGEAVAAEGEAAQSGQEVSTLLDTVQTVANGIEDPAERQEYLDRVGALALRATSGAVVQAQGTDPARIDTLLAGVTELAPLLGIPEEQLKGIAGTLLEITHLDPSDLGTANAFMAALGAKLEELPGGAEGRAAQMLGGLGLALGVVQVAEAWEGWSEADVKTQIATMASTVQLGADGGIWAMELLGKAVPSSLRAASVVAGGIIAGVEVLNGVNAWQDGNRVGAVGHGLLAAGGGLMALGATTLSIPVAGWIAGAAMILGGAIMVGIGEGNEAREKREGFLRAAGVPEDIIATLAEDPTRAKQLADMGFTMDQLTDLARRAPNLFTQSDGEAGSIQGLVALQRQFGMNADQMHRLLTDVMAATPDNPAGAVGFLVRNSGGIGAGGMMPTTREGWMEQYSELLASIDAERDPELHATVSAILASLQSLP